MHNSILEGKRRNETGKTEGEEKGKRGRRGGKGARELREGVGGSRRKGKRGRERMGRDRKGDGMGENEHPNCRLYSSCHYLHLPHDHIEV